jgi:hypothetical protein
MSYLVGRFDRENPDYNFNKGNPLPHLEVVNEIEKTHLLLAKNDLDYQVINLETLEYYDPEKNQWVKIKKS